MIPHSQQKISERGYTLVVVMILLGLTAFVVREALKRSSLGSGIIYESRARASRLNAVENSLYKTITYLRDNSHKYASPFDRANFYTKFDRIGSSSVGANDTTLGIPTQLWLDGTSNTALLTNDNALLGTEAFPASTNITDGTAATLTGTLSGASLGTGKVRVTLLDAIGETTANDTAPTPTTDFDPIYRVDSMTDIDEGAHLYAILRGDIVNLFDYGVYGKTAFTFAGTCDSYNSASGDYSSGIKAAGCVAGSYSTSAISMSGTIYGELHNNYRDSSVSGSVCSNFTVGCPNAGKKCNGKECAPLLLDQFLIGGSSTFATYCPTNQGNSVANCAITTTLQNGQCWNQLGGRAGCKNTLTSCKSGCTYNGTYYANILGFQSSTTNVDFTPTLGTGVVELYFWSVTSNTLYDTNIYNNTTGQRPLRLRLYYMGTTSITISGTTQPIRAFIVAPFAQVTVAANVKIYGGLVADTVIVNSGAEIHYDSSMAGEGIVEDMQYRIRQITEVHR